VSKAELMSDIWRLAFVPETNSVAVHVSRLRAKLALAGLAGLVQTSSTGGYFLASPDFLPDDASFLPPARDRLDGEARKDNKGLPALEPA
jgi:DNA-binding winged helix-turn-helix (wHTH) protein